MKTSIVSPPSRIPNPGECWRHRGAKNVYMRIRDEDGRKAKNHSATDLYFYSVLLGGEGVIVFTSINSDSFELLQPVGGECKFEPFSD